MYFVESWSMNCIEVISARPELDAFFDTVAGGARDWDGRDPGRTLG